MQTGSLVPHIVQILDNGQDVTIIELVQQLQKPVVAERLGENSVSYQS